jgi:hypothetical protein
MNQSEALEAIAGLVLACEVAFAGPEMADFDDADDISEPPTGITFGMIRRAREALTPTMTMIEPGDDTVSGIELIAFERMRQLDQEGWTAEHDDTHMEGELALAAVTYAMPPARRDGEVWINTAGDDDLRLGRRPFSAVTWPWKDSWWKPTPQDRIRELAKAGALVAAEIDRVQRAEA